MASLSGPTIVVEDDPFLRMLQLILDVEVPDDRMNAFADFFITRSPTSSLGAKSCARQPLP
jgi:hypothetical protein